MNLMPSILHAAWLPLQETLSGGELFLWCRNLDYAVQPQSTVDTPTAVGNDERQRVPSHPQQMPLGQLRQQLLHQFPGLSIDKMRPTSATAWFPTSNGIPESRRTVFQHASTQNSMEDILPIEKEYNGDHSDSRNGIDEQQPSTDDLAGQDDSSEKNIDGIPSVEHTVLAPWQITGIAISAIDALRFLSQLSNQEILDTSRVHTNKDELDRSDDQNGAIQKNGTPLLLDRLRIGNDLLFFSSISKFALEILVGQHYLPSVWLDASCGFFALWQPAIFDAKIQERFEALIQEMPPVCRAYNLESPSDALSAAHITERIVATLADSAIREWATFDQLQQDHQDTQNQDTQGAEPPPEQQSHAELQHSTPTNYWFEQLVSQKNRLSLPPQPLHRLYREWNAWMDQLHVASDAGFRICFVLAEPATIPDDDSSITSAIDNNWRLSYHLQSRSNPQIMIAAKDIWTTASTSLTIEDMRIDQPQEHFLAGLGAVSHLFDPIAQSLTNSRPEFAELTVHEAYQFMREVGPLLQSSGFGVIMPAWWAEREERQLGLRLRLASDDELMIDDLPGLNTEVDYSWELTLGDELIDREAFQHLVELDSPLVRVHNRWTELNPAQLNAARGFLQGDGAENIKPNGNTALGHTRGDFGKITLLQALRMITQKGSGFSLDLDDKHVGKLHDPNLISAAELDSAMPPQAEDSVEPALDLNVTNTVIEMPSLLPLTGVHLDGWLDKAIERLQHNDLMPEIMEPSGFVGTLRPYQRRGVAWLIYLRRLGIGACLADDMGLGKTIQAIALHLSIKESREEQRQNRKGAPKLTAAKTEVYPTLLICPTSVLANWQREINRFAPNLRAIIHHGNNRLTDDAFLDTAAEQDFVITSYGTARRDIDFLENPLWQDVILDEAQNIKNPNAKQTQAVRRLRSQHRIALTGTPIENRLSELWSIFEFLNPNYLGGHDRFHKQYILPIERYNSERHVNRLRQMVQPFLLRRLKTDPTIISDLPEKNEMIVYCSLTQEQQRLYTGEVEKTLNTLDSSEGIQRRGLILGLITKLKQISNHPAHYLKQKADTLQLEELRNRSGKLSRLAEMLEEALSVGDHALIFTQFVEMGELLQSYLSNILGEEIPFLHGGTSAMQRDRMVQHFQSEDGPPVFILSLRAGGSGLNLTRANHVFHYDRWWNPAIENQATDRAFRIGQLRNVQVHKFVAAGTLEEHIHSLIESKKALAENIVGSGEDWLTEMDNNQLRKLLMLRSDIK